MLHPPLAMFPLWVSEHLRASFSDPVKVELVLAGNPYSVLDAPAFFLDW